MVIDQFKKAGFSKKKINKIVELAGENCEVTPEEVCGEAEMSLHDQIKVATYIHSQTGLVVDYGEVTVEVLDEDTINTIFNEVYDTNRSNRKIKKRYC